MLATFWGTRAAELVAVSFVGVLAFILAWFLLGTAARAKADRAIAQRMRGAGRPDAPPPEIEAGGGGWIPAGAAKFGRRFAGATGIADLLDARLEAAGSNLRSGEFVFAAVIAAFVGGVVGFAILRNLILALIIAAISAVGPEFALRLALSRRADKLRDQLPDVLTIMASSLRSGHSFLQALDTVSKEIAQPAASEFIRVIAEVRLGRPVEEALESLADRVGSDDFRWAVLAVNIQREVGGNLAEILDNVADTLRERATMRRQVRVLTSEGRLSAYVLIALPFAIAIYMFAVNPSYIELLIKHTGANLFGLPLGWWMLGGAAVGMSIGVAWMKKIVNIDV
jgi:tight adherence protein B